MFNKFFGEINELVKYTFKISIENGVFPENWKLPK